MFDISWIVTCFFYIHEWGYCTQCIGYTSLWQTLYNRYIVVLFTTVYVHDAHSSLIFSDITLKRGSGWGYVVSFVQSCVNDLEYLSVLGKVE